MTLMVMKVHGVIVYTVVYSHIFSQYIHKVFMCFSIELAAHNNSYSAISHT